MSCHKGDVLLEQALADEHHGYNPRQHVCTFHQEGKASSYETDQRTTESIARDIQKCQIC